jgi:hypothetical protein
VVWPVFKVRKSSALWPGRTGAQEEGENRSTRVASKDGVVCKSLRIEVGQGDGLIMLVVVQMPDLNEIIRGNS